MPWGKLIHGSEPAPEDNSTISHQETVQLPLGSPSNEGAKRSSLVHCTSPQSRRQPRSDRWRLLPCTPRRRGGLGQPHRTGRRKRPTGPRRRNPMELRGKDVRCILRMGWESYLAPRRGEPGAQQKAKRIRRRVQQAAFQTERGPGHEAGNQTELGRGQSA